MAELGEITATPAQSHLSLGQILVCSITYCGKPLRSLIHRGAERVLAQ